MAVISTISACGGLTVWAAATQFRAKQCLDGALHPAAAGVTSAFGFVVLGIAASVVSLRHARRPSR